MNEVSHQTFLTKTAELFRKLFDFSRPGLWIESWFVVLIAVLAAVFQAQSDDGDGRADALLSGVLMFRCLLAVGPPENEKRSLSRPIIAVAGILMAIGLAAAMLGIVPIPLPAAFSFRNGERMLPLLAILLWWLAGAPRAPGRPLVASLLLAAVAVSFWTDLWDLISSVAASAFLESTIRAATTGLYWLGMDVVRQGVTLKLGSSGRGIEILLGCTGLPILRLLLKVIIAESAVLGVKNWGWYLKAALIAFAIAMFVGPIRVAALVLADAKGIHSFEFWHGTPGISLFSAIAMVVFIFVVGRLKNEEAANLH